MSTRFSAFPRDLWLLATAFLACTIFPIASQAEGSRTLYPSGYTQSRADLFLDGSSTNYINAIRRQTFIYVYAQAGEYILTGSSSRVDPTYNPGDIRIYNPQSFGTPGNETIPGTANFTCSTSNSPPGSYGGGTRGEIATRAQELAGPMNASATVASGGRFIPCAYQAPTTGIYGVLFTPASGSGIAVQASGSISSLDPTNRSVAAWDVTVRSDATSLTDINGRIFTYAWVGFTGANGRPIDTTHYYVTKDGYRYSEQLKGLDPNGFAIYGNTFGFQDNGQPLFKDIVATDDSVSTGLPAGITTQAPQFPIFFSDISPSGANNTEVSKVLSALGFPTTPASPTVSNVSFTGSLGSSVTTPGVGGTFTFTTQNTITYEIVISRDGVNYDPANVNNAVLTGISTGGTQTITWNGKDNAGTNFPVQSAPYPFRVIGHAGDIHLPLIDAERNPGAGPVVTVLNGVNAGNNTVYYDDRGYVTKGGTTVGTLNGSLDGSNCPAVKVSLTGVNSTTSYRNWSSCGSADWGNTKGLDLWTYTSTQPQIQYITITTSPTVQVAKTSLGSVGTFNFTLSNLSFTSDTVTTTVSGTRVASLQTNIGTLNTAATVTETAASAAGYSTTYSCTDANAANDGVGAASPITGTGTVATIPAAQMVAKAVWTCTFTNTRNQANITLSKTGPATAYTGKAVGYTIGLGNSGGSPSGTTLTVADQLPVGAIATAVTAGSGVSSVNCGTLPSAPGALLNCTVTLNAPLAAGSANGTASFQLTVTAPTSAGSVTNYATTDPTGGSSPPTPGSGCTPATSCGSATTDVKPQADLELKKTVDNATPRVGDTITFTLTLTNKGPDTASNVIVSDSLPPGLSLTGTPVSSPQGSYDSVAATWSVGTLTLNQAVTLTMQAKVLASGSITNTAAITTNGGPEDSNDSNNTATSTINAGPTSDIQVSKTVDNPTPNVGSNITYTVTVKNAGPSNATGVQITDTLPAGLTLISATPSVGTYTASVWNIGALINNATATLTIIARVDASGSITNTATKTAGNEFDPNSTNNQSGVTVNGQQADIQIFKTVSNANPAINTNVTFTITATNQGPSAATGVVVKDALPAGLTLVSATPSQGSYNSTTGLWTVGSLAASGTGATATLTIVAKVTQTGSLTNIAIKTASDQTDPNSNNNTSTVALNGIQIIAQNDTGGTVSGASGGQAYANVLNNNGNGPDTLNGAPVTLSTVNLTQLSTTNSGVTLDPATGAVNVAPGTPAGTYSVIYQICDRLNPGICSTATATVVVTAATISASNDAGTPVTSAGGGTAVSNVLSNDKLNGATPTAGSGGTVILSPVGTLPAGIRLNTTTGAVTVDPGTFPGSYNFQYQICEALNPTNCAVANVTVPVGPQASNDANNTAMNTPVSGSVATNDRYQVGSTFTLTGTSPANGTVILNPDGTYTYTPKANFVGTDTFTYQVCAPAPNQTVCSTATVTITVLGTGNIVTQPDTATTPANTPVQTNVLANDSSTGASLNPNSVTVPTTGTGAPSNGTVVCSAGNCTYTPNPGFSGTDTYTYQVCDTRTPTPVCATQTVTVVVGPNATNDATSTPMNTLVTGNVASNDRYPPGSTFTATSTPAHGGVSLNPDGSYSYTPSPNFVGTDTFTYQVCAPAPNQTLCSTATVTVTINAAGNITLNPDTATTPANTPVQTNVLANDSSTGAPLNPASLTIVGTPSNGAVICNNTGVCTYTPNPGFLGTDTYTYRACDTRTPTPVCATQTVTVTVSPAGPPQAVNDTATTPTNTPVNGTVASNDTYPAGSIFSKASDPANGTVVVNPDGTYTYTPNPNFVGTDTFTYKVCAPAPNQTSCSTATVTVTVSPAGTPQAVNDTATTLANTPISGTVAGNDPYPAGSVFSKVSDPANGKVVFNPDGTYTYTPNPNFVGTDTFTYKVCAPAPNQTSCSTAMVSITVTKPADLSIHKSSSPDPYIPGQALTYTVVASNAGPNDVVGAKVTDTLPAAFAGFNWTCSASAGSRCTGSGSGNLNDTVDVRTGGTLTYTFKGTVPSGTSGSQRNTATVTPPAGISDPTPLNNTVVNDNPSASKVDLSVDKRSSPNPYIPGQRLTYTIEVRNAGPSDAVNALVSDPLPNALAKADFGWTCRSSLGSRCAVSGRGDINDTVTLLAGGILTYTVSGTVPIETRGVQTNTVTVSAPAGVNDEGARNNVASSSTDSMDPTAIPTLSQWAMLLLLTSLLLLAWRVLELRAASAKGHG